MNTEKTPVKIPNLVEKIHACLKDNKYRLTDHAIERHHMRNINLPIIRHVLLTGTHTPSQDRYRKQFNRWSYAICGEGLDGEKIKVVIAFPDHENIMFIVTVMLIDRE